MDVMFSMSLSSPKDNPELAGSVMPSYLVPFRDLIFPIHNIPGATGEDF